MTGRRGRVGASSFVPLCVVWITRNSKITPNKRGTGKGHWRVPFNSPVSILLLPSTHVHVSLPCSAANQVKGSICQWDSQMGNVLFRTPYSQLSTCTDWKFMEINHSLKNRTIPEIAKARPGKRKRCEWKHDLGFNEAQMNGSQTPAVITQSPGWDTPGRAKSCMLLVHSRATVPSHILAIGRYDV